MREERVPVAREGIPFLLGAALCSVTAAASGRRVLGAASLGAALFTLYFFRDPERYPPQGEGLAVAPADGRVVGAEEVEAGPFVKARRRRLSIFMSLLSCHVNRSPVEGVVEGLRYREGSFRNAAKGDASERNEALALLIRTPEGHEVEVVQVAGLLARRIVCRAEPGDRLRLGERYGMIRFGSRLDLYLPPASELLVEKGARVRAGETPVARLAPLGGEVP